MGWKLIKHSFGFGCILHQFVIRNNSFILLSSHGHGTAKLVGSHYYSLWHLPSFHLYMDTAKLIHYYCLYIITSISGEGYSNSFHALRITESLSLAAEEIVLIVIK